MASILSKRQYLDYNGGNQNGDGSTGDDYYSWWYTNVGIAVKYSLWGALFIALLLYFIGGRIHAQRRIGKGLPPLAYHRWLLSRQYRARADPSFAQPTYRPMYGNPPFSQTNGQSFGMQDYAAPPPAYNSDVPPIYQPPAGASKVDPQQVHIRDVTHAAEGPSSPRNDGGPMAPGPVYHPGDPLAPR